MSHILEVSIALILRNIFFFSKFGTKYHVLSQNIYSCNWLVLTDLHYWADWCSVSHNLNANEVTQYLILLYRFHSLHHTQFRTNYSLFMPFYDYIYSTMDKSSDDLYKRSLKGKEEVPDVVHLTHLTTLQSIYHLRIGFASLASKPYNSKMPILLMWPVAWTSMLLTWIYSSSFTVERNGFKKIKMQTWAIPRFKFQVRNVTDKKTNFSS